MLVVGGQRQRTGVGGVGVARSVSACPPAAATAAAAAAVAAAIDIHTYKQHKLQRRIGDARPAYESSWHLGDFNDPFCATTQLTLVLSSEKEIINRPCYRVCV
jgi:hypothetical protein